MVPYTKSCKLQYYLSLDQLYITNAYKYSKSWNLFKKQLIVECGLRWEKAPWINEVFLDKLFNFFVFKYKSIPNLKTGDLQNNKNNLLEYEELFFNKKNYFFFVYRNFLFDETLVRQGFFQSKISNFQTPFVFTVSVDKIPNFKTLARKFGIIRLNCFNLFLKINEK